VVRREELGGLELERRDCSMGGKSGNSHCFLGCFGRASKVGPGEAVIPHRV